MATQSGPDHQLDPQDSTSAALAMAVSTSGYSPTGTFGEEPASAATALPGEPASQPDVRTLDVHFDCVPDYGPGEPAQDVHPDLSDEAPGEPASSNRGRAALGSGTLGTGLGVRKPRSSGKVAETGVPATMHPTALSSTLVPQVGQEIAELGREAGEQLRQRRMAERRWLFAQRGTRGPDDSPFQDHTFDPSVNYRGAEWGMPVPQAEWERRVYVELNLATDRRHEGKGAPPMCHACRRVGSRTVPLAKCVCCDNWACHRHLLVPACLDRIYPMCSSHPGLEVRPRIDFSLENRLRDQGTCSGCPHRHWTCPNVGLSQRQHVCLGYQQQGWIPPNLQIGEAKKPGPSICSANPGGWSRIDGVLNLQHDVVAVQETFVLREQMSGAKYTADKLGYYSSFTPARKTDGRPSGGLALLCRQAQPLQRMEKGTHWELGRWAHHLLPFEGGLHVFNVYGYSSEKDRAQELNGRSAWRSFRRLLLLVTGRSSYWGTGISSLTTFPLICSMGASKALLPACGMELDTGNQPDHVAICLDFRLELVSQGYQGPKSYETAERTTEHEVGVEYGRARQAHLARWSTALASQDVDQLWDLWCRAAEQALGLPVHSRGRLLLGNQQMLVKVPDEEAVETAKQQDTVVTPIGFCHGDDFVIACSEENAEAFGASLRKKFEVKLVGLIGEAPR
eukprot:6491630-Amphidinium_carterae.3